MTRRLRVNLLVLALAIAIYLVVIELLRIPPALAFIGGMLVGVVAQFGVGWYLDR